MFDVNILLSGFDLKPMFAPEYVEKLSNLSDDFDKKLKAETLKFSSPFFDSASIYSGFAELWDKHKELMVLINPYIKPINILNELASNLQISPYLDNPEDVIAVSLLYSIYMNHYDQLLRLVSFNDVLIQIHHEKHPNQPTPEVLIRNIMPSMHKLQSGDFEQFNVFHEVLKGMNFKPNESLLPSIKVICEIKPEKRLNAIFEYLNKNGRINYRDRLMAYQLRNEATKEVKNIFDGGDFPKIAYIDRTQAQDGKIIYKLFICPAPLEIFQSHLTHFGVRLAEDSLMYEWIVNDDQSILKNWLDFCAKVDGVNDTNFDQKFEITSVDDLDSIQMINIANFLCNHFEYYYFNGIGMFKNNLIENKVNMALIHQNVPNAAS